MCNNAVYKQQIECR